MALKTQLRRPSGVKVPSLPGVYFFRNKTGKILYIGKAANLKARLASYYLGVQHLSVKTRALLKEASSISWKILGSETEALIKESELIKKNQPKYNVLMRDDKQYFFVAFSKEKYPRIYLTHQTPKGPEYIGPFTDGGAIKSVLKLLRRIFSFCTCKKTHKNLCLNARIERCLGYCCIQNAESHTSHATNYKQNISSVKKILSGKNKSLLRKLKKEMKKLSQKQNYEEAGKARDQIKALTKIFAHKEIILRDFSSETVKAISALESLLKIEEIKRIEAYDIANIQGKYAYGSMAVFINGTPAKNLYRIFKIKSVHRANDVAMLKEVIARRFKHKEWEYPDVILVDGGKAQLNAIRHMAVIALTKDSHHHGHHIFISGRIEPLLLQALTLSLRNLLLQLDSEAHRFAIRHYRQSHRNMLSLN